MDNNQKAILVLSAFCQTLVCLMSFPRLLARVCGLVQLNTLSQGSPGTGCIFDR